VDVAASDLMRLLTSRERDDDDVGRALIRSLDVLHADLRRLDAGLAQGIETALRDALETALQTIDRHAEAQNRRLEALERVVTACAEGMRAK
jgi:hypothetical protein